MYNILQILDFQFIWLEDDAFLITLFKIKFNCRKIIHSAQLIRFLNIHFNLQEG